MRPSFSALSQKGISKVGDVLIPGDGALPSFSAARLWDEHPRMTDHMVEEDRNGLRLLTLILGLSPILVVRFILWVATKNGHFPGVIGSTLRQIHLGLRGVIFTLYYSGIDDIQGHSVILDGINYSTTIGTKISKDQEMETLLENANPLTKNFPKPILEAPDVDATYARARIAFAEIAALTVAQRLTYVNNLRRVILRRQEEITDVIQKETRKSRTDILTSEFFPLFEHLDFLEQEAEKALVEEKVATPISMMGKSSKIWFEPLGTILVISPWNYPFYQAIVPITCAFVTGNATVYKPSEVTPLQGLVESVLAEAGFQDAWAQVVYGDGALGAELIRGRPQKIFFTGSVATGKKIMGLAAQFLIPVELELGGKDPMLVFEDANLERAVKGATWGAFTNTGQSCTSVERLYVHRSIYETFRDRLVQEARKLTQGVDSDGSADLGAMISPRQVEIVAELVKDALARGARMLSGESWDFTSSFIPPIILEGTDHTMRINREEIFGPVLPIMEFTDEDHAVELANDSDFGLSASVWTKDKERALRVSRRIVTGNVSINNVMVSEGNHALPFGGVKDSGIGRYKGAHGLRSFTNIKSILVDADSKKIEANWYPYTARKYDLLKGLTQSLFGGGLKKWVGLVRFGLPLEGHAQKERPKSSARN